MLTRRAFLAGSLLLTLPRLSHARTWQVTSHPLNDPGACAGWWLTTPDSMPCAWRDLVRGRIGVMSTASLWRRMSPRRGSFGELAFSGGSEDVTLPALLNTPAQLTLSCWVRTSVGNARQALLTKCASYATGAGWYLITHLNGTLGFWLQDAGAGTYSGLWGGDLGLSVADGLWHHVVVVMPSWSAAAMSLWLDGALYPTTTEDVGVTAPTTSEPLRLGQFGDGVYPLTGALDDVRLYTRALTPAAIAMLHTAPWQQYHPVLAPAPVLAFVPPVPTAVRGPGLFLQ